MSIRIIWRSAAQTCFCGFILCQAISVKAEQYASPPAGRVIIDMNANWRFCAKDIVNGQSIDIDESVFKPVCLPHSVKIVRHANIDTSSFAIVSWYRRHISIPAEYKGRRFFLEFQGVSKMAEVFVNSKRIGEHKGAYTPFTLDITDAIEAGKDNVVAVRVDSRQRKDIPPEGINVDYMLFGGIVRDVALIVTDPLHVDWVFVSRDSIDPSRVSVKTQVVNNYGIERNCRITTVIVDTSNNIVATGTASQTIAADSNYEFYYTTNSIANPILWHPDNPYLYKVYTAIDEGKQCVDECKLRFGMRTIKFDKTDDGFYINGKQLKLRGLNRHETFPYIGRAASNRLQRRDAQILKYDLGCNIVRCSHYPQDPEFLDCCDEIGLMVMEEMPGWMYVSKSAAWQDIALKNVEEMVLRDRNHPSIISFGVRVNESSDFHDLYVKTNQAAKKLDPTRPTHGVRVLDRGSTDEFIEDVWAQNFKIPVSSTTMPWITTESVGSRYKVRSWDDESRLVAQMLAFASVNDSAMACAKLSGIIGWAAFDYNSPYRYAENQVCYHGVSDIFRLPKHAAYFFKSQADPSVYGSMVYIAHYWKKALEPNDVWVASNCDSVELFVNDISKGKIAPNRFLHLAHPFFVWSAVPFKAGEVKAVGYIGSNAVVTHVRKTPGKPIRLAISPDDNVLETGGDMTRVVVTALDVSGQVVPRENSTVTITVSGAGEFFGESPVALEDGKTVFFIKTKSKQAGIIECKVKGKIMPEVKVRVTVNDNGSLHEKN